MNFLNQVRSTFLVEIEPPSEMAADMAVLCPYEHLSNESCCAVSDDNDLARKAID